MHRYSSANTGTCCHQLRWFAPAPCRNRIAARCAGVFVIEAKAVLVMNAWCALFCFTEAHLGRRAQPRDGLRRAHRDPRVAIAAEGVNAILGPERENPHATELHDLSIAELTGLIAARKLSSVELTEA